MSWRPRWLIAAMLTLLSSFSFHWLYHSRSSTSLEVLEWLELQRLMSIHNLTNKPYIIRNSPQQLWLAKSNGLWTPAHMLLATNSANSNAGSTLVTLKSQPSKSFTHYYHSSDSSDVRSSSHTSTLTPLHDALRLIWPPLPTTSTGTTFYYLSPDMQTMPPEMLPYNEDTLLQFIPEGCLQDDTRHSSSSSSSQLCRGLTSNMWLGQAGGVSAAVHYDLQHNIFLQASGSKRFTLLPPSTHHLLRLHPRWHGSQRQSQGSEDTSWPAAISTETFVLQVELNEGDALYIPPLWFHLVERNVRCFIFRWPDSE